MTSGGPRQAAPRPVIGLACAWMAGQSGRHGWEGVSAPYLQAVRGAGADPLLIPMELPESSLPRVVAMMDGILLVGGGDVEPSCYGAQRDPKCGPSDERRDRSEIALVHEALRQGKPLLAICRGIQVLNVALGGTLHQDIPSDFPDSTLTHSDNPRQSVAHTVRVEPASRLAELVGAQEMGVNSMHHQAVKDVAPDLRPVAWAPDGVVEAVEMPGHALVLGVQWHPEELVAEHHHARRLFEALAHQSLACHKG
ncbi:MAG: gamma-glutamyl-gamma-aminobutyrate hydrolase family protein [Anaerolineae bacterium]